MSSIGGGLYDQDRDPDYAPASRPRSYEWLFWSLMLLGAWAAFQGWPKLAIVVLAPVLFLGGVMVLSRIGSKEIRSWYW